MNFSFNTQGTNTYLVYEVEKSDRIDSMSLGMLTNNKIPGLAPTIFTQMDETKYIKYNVSSKISVRQFFSGPVNKKRLLGVFNGITDAMLSAEDYMIDPNTILLELDYIFADVSSCNTVLICLPIINNSSEKNNIGAFFKNLMFSTQFDQTENCDHVAKIINYLNSSPAFSLSDFKKLLREINASQSPDTTYKAAVNQNTVVKPPQARINTVVPPAVTVQPTQMRNPVPPQKTPVNQAQPKIPAGRPPFNKPTQRQTSKKQTPHGEQFAMPPKNSGAPKSVPAVNTDEKPMSLFYLMQHYNSENAAIYKAQKAAKKNSAPSGNNNETAATSYTVPGAPGTNMNFPVPGQAPASERTAVQNRKANPLPAQEPLVQTNLPQTPTFQQYPQGQPLSFGETTVLGADLTGETTVLGASNHNQTVMSPYLFRAKNNENILLNKPVFRIGKEKSYVDYFIGDNTAISRSHANIISRDGKYFIVDTNSTNHTFVNGQMIQSNTEVEISNGSKIRLANEDFEFKLY